MNTGIGPGNAVSPQTMVRREGDWKMNSKKFWLGAVKENWYLFVVLAGLPFVAIAIGGRAADDSTDASSGSAEAAVVHGKGDETPTTPRSASPFKAPQTSDEKARSSIARYERQNKQNPEGDGVALNLMRMGNLYYATLHEYEAAIQKYELLINRFPDFDRIKDVYPALAECYGRTGQTVLQSETYRRMLKEFPENSEHHKFAADRLKPTI